MAIKFPLFVKPFCMSFGFLLLLFKCGVFSVVRQILFLLGCFHNLISFFSSSVSLPLLLGSCCILEAILDEDFSQLHYAPGHFFSQFVEKGFRFVLNFCFAASTENTLVDISFFEQILIFYVCDVFSVAALVAGISKFYFFGSTVNEK